MSKNTGDLESHFRACHLCEAICGIEILHKDGEIHSIRGDKNDPLSKGHICPKATALEDLQNDPDRLRKPMVKQADGSFKAVDWDTAFQTVADGMASILKKHGSEAVATYQGNPTVHNLGLVTHAAVFMGLLKTKTRFSATSVDQLPLQLACHWLYGHGMRVPVPDVERTDFMLIIGANPLASNGSLMTAPGMRHHLKAISERGEVVVIDPKKTATAKVADRHFFIRPGEDAAFLLSMLHVLFDEDLVKPGKLASYLDGLDQVQALVQGFTPEKTAELTGIDADTTRDLARKLANTKRAVAYGRMGISVQKHGALCNWAIQVLNILTGHLDTVGGAMFPAPAIDMAKAPVGRPSHFAQYHTKKRGLPEFNGELPSIALAEEIEGDADGKIRALATIAGNPVLSVPDGRRLDTALEGLEFMVSFDNWINETTRHADVILPGPGPLQKNHYDLVFNSFAVRNYARWSDALLPLEDGQLHDHEVLNGAGKALAAALGTEARTLPGSKEVIDGMLSMTDYPDLDLDRLQASNHGADLGPLQPHWPEASLIPDGRIPLLPEGIAEDIDRVAENLVPASNEEYPFMMIGRRDVRSCNSWLHNAQRMVKGKDHSRAEIHPEDAARLNIGDGDKIRLSTRIGHIEPLADVTDAVMPGVICFPHGWGHNRDGSQLATASAHAGESANDIIDGGLYDKLSGNAAVQAVPVHVAKAG